MTRHKYLLSDKSDAKYNLYTGNSSHQRHRLIDFSAALDRNSRDLQFGLENFRLIDFSG